MSTRRIIPMIVFFLAPAVACTSGGDPGSILTPSATSATSATPTSPVSTGPVRFEPGAYRYEFGGVTADLRFVGSVATMDVRNTSGEQLAAPSLYVVEDTGTHRDGEVADAAPIPGGASATFEVTFPDQVTKETIGLVILLFGDSNYGAFAPVPVRPDG